MPVRRRPWWSRMSGPQLLMLVVGVLAFLANLVVLRGQDDVALVAVARVDLNPGLVMESSEHLAFVEVEGSSPLLARGVSRDVASTLDGQIVTVSRRRIVTLFDGLPEFETVDRVEVFLDRETDPVTVRPAPTAARLQEHEHTEATQAGE